MSPLRLPASRFSGSVLSTSRARRRLGATSGWALVAIALLVVVAACESAGDGTATPAAEDDPLLRSYQDVAQAETIRSPSGVIAAGSPAAADAGARILAAGGNAVDAAVAAAFTLGSSDPGGSGLGGATFMLIHLADGRTVALDGSTPAPLAARAEVLAELAARDALFGHATVAPPTTVAVLATALRRYGTMGFSDVLAPAIEAAVDGYEIDWTERAFVGDYRAKLTLSPTLAQGRLVGGRPLPVGSHVDQPVLARTLARLARRGADDFYRGAVAAEIDADMRRHGGFVRLADLALVRPVERPPVRGVFRGHEVLSIGHPCGGTAVVEALQILDQLPPESLASPDARRLGLLANAVRVAQADATRAAAGSELEGELLGRDHAAQRAALLGGTGPVTVDDGPASPWPATDGNTTHLSVADAAGNVVALTQSLGRFFGAGVADPALGFPYNCLLEVFDHDDPASPYYLRPQAVVPAATAPTIVLDPGGGLRLALGSAGSDRITSAVVDVTVAALADGRRLGEAVAAPRVLWTGGHEARLALEIAPPFDDALADRLVEHGWPDVYRLRFPARTIDLVYFGGVNLVGREPGDDAVTAVADPRRNGAVAAAGGGGG